MQFAMNVEYRFFPRHEFVFHFGDKGDYFFIVLKGEADIFIPKSTEEISKERTLMAN